VMLAALAVGTILSALTVAYRDFKYTVPFLIQLWMFATPAIYMGTHHGEPAPKGKTAIPIPANSTSVTDSVAVADKGTLEKGTLDNGLPVENMSDLVANNAAERANPVLGPTIEAELSSKSPHHGDQRKKQVGGGAVPDWIQDLLKYNPMNGVIRSFRAALLGQPIPWVHLGYSTVIIVTFFVVGCFYFHRMEDRFADII